MRLLLVEDTVGAGIGANIELLDVGHTVFRCGPAAGDPVLCAAIADGAACPIDGGVDLVVDVRAGNGPQTAGELGAFCAQRACVPILALPQRYDVVLAVEAAAARSIGGSAS